MTSLLAMLTGVLIAVTVVQNGDMAAYFGNYLGTVMVHAVGLVTILAVLLVRRTPIRWDRKTPVHAYFGGVLGVLTVLGCNSSFAALGVSVSVAMMLLGQTAMGAAVDQFGLFGAVKRPFSPSHLVSFLLIAGGVGTMLLTYDGRGAALLLVAALVGANTVVCRYLNTLYASRNGLPMGTLANYVTGFLASLLVLLAVGEPAAPVPVGPLTFRTGAMFLGGAVGVALIQLSIYITPRLPAFVSTLLIFVSQLSAGLLLDFVLTGAFSPAKLLGGLLVMVGLWHFSRVGRRAGAKTAGAA
jgi:transporter family-2 protein